MKNGCINSGECDVYYNYTVAVKNLLAMYILRNENSVGIFITVLRLRDATAKLSQPPNLVHHTRREAWTRV